MCALARPSSGYRSGERPLTWSGIPVGLGIVAAILAIQGPAGAEEALRIEDAIRLALTNNERAQKAPLRVETADGTLTRIRPDGELGVAVETVQLTDGSSQPWTGEGVVIFPAPYIRRIERSELSRSRTTIGALALAGGLFAIAAIALKTTGSQSAGDAGGGSPPP